MNTTCNIPNAADLVPLMFQAQTKGRSQLQYISKSEVQDSQRWAAEWTEEVYPHAPKFGENVQTKIYTIQWRFVTNGGQDEGIIRPVIGAYGLPFYPGSSMKGAFYQACTQEQRTRYRLTKNGDEPSLLRFHGGYPINDWTEKLIDIVHPQQAWQVKTSNPNKKPDGESGFALISLYQPTIKFGISSLIPNTNWDEVWQIWEKALGYGIGCRVSSGYGLPKACINENGESSRIVNIQGKLLYRVHLKGQGQAPNLISENSEFRPNIFRGALRGHALRIFGGLTDENTAENLVDSLFGGIRGEGTQGLLAVAFQESNLKIGTFADGYDEPTYNVAGELRWLLTRSLEEENKNSLNKLLRGLMRFAILLGGFGKSWRRADHRLFYEEYYDNKKPLIGCHWQWDKSSLGNDTKVKSLNHVAPFINEVRQTAQQWMQLQGVTANENQISSWREAWHPDNVQVWGRLTEGTEDCKAIKWVHQPYQQADRQTRQTQLSIQRTSITGSINRIGRLWHRMYPLLHLSKNPEGQTVRRKPNNYLELLTIFPDHTQECHNFLNFLEAEAARASQTDSFQKLW